MNTANTRLHPAAPPIAAAAPDSFPTATPGSFPVVAHSAFGTSSPSKQAAAFGSFPVASLGASFVRPDAPAAFEGAIFDLDGTLIDSMPWWEDLGENYLRQRGKTPAPDIRFHFKRLTMAGAARYMKETYGLGESVDEIFAGVLGGIEKAYHESIPLKPGVAEALEAFAAHGVRMCVATASEPHCVHAALERLNVLHYFSAVLTCAEMGTSKTQPLIFETALEHLGTPRETTLVWEDSLHALETAHAIALPTVAVAEPSSADDLPAIQAIANIYLESFERVATREHDAIIGLGRGMNGCC